MLSTKLTKKQIAAEKQLKIVQKKKQKRINKKLTGEIYSPFLTQTKKPVKSKKSQVQGKDIKKPKGILKKTGTPNVSNEKIKRKYVQINTEVDTQVPSKKQKRSLEADKVVLKNDKSDKIENDSKKKRKMQDVTKDKEVSKGTQQASPKPKKAAITTPLVKVNKPNSLKKGAAATKNKTELISAVCNKKSVRKAVKPDADKVATQSILEQSNNENTEEQSSISSDVKESLDVSETSIKKDLKAGKKKKIRSKRLSRKKLLLKPKTLKRKQAGAVQETTSRGVCYFNHLPHGFYEKQLLAYCSQFGKVTGVYHPVSKGGNSKGFAFVEFQHSEVAQVVADTMNNYLMFNRLLKCEYVPAERQKPWVFKRTTNLQDIAIANRKVALNSRMKTLTEDEIKKRRTNRLAKIEALKKNFPYEFQVEEDFELIEESTSLKEES